MKDDKLIKTHINELNNFLKKTNSLHYAEYDADNNIVLRQKNRIF